MPRLRGGAPEVEAGDCMDLAKSLNKMQEFLHSWGEHMVDIRVGACCQDEMLEDETPLENAVTASQLLAKFRLVKRQDGFDLSCKTFNSILDRCSAVVEQANNHKNLCQMGRYLYTDELTMFNLHLVKVLACAKKGGLYKEPSFLPDFTSTPSQNSHSPRVLSPRTPGSSAIKGPGQSFQRAVGKSLFTVREDSQEEKEEEHQLAVGPQAVAGASPSQQSKHKDYLKSLKSVEEIKEQVAKDIEGWKGKGLNCPYCNSIVKTPKTLYRHMRYV